MQGYQSLDPLNNIVVSIFIQGLLRCVDIFKPLEMCSSGILPNQYFFLSPKKVAYIESQLLNKCYRSGDEHVYEKYFSTMDLL